MSENEDYKRGYKFGFLRKRGIIGCSVYPVVIDDPVEDKDAFICGIIAAGYHGEVKFIG